LVYGRILHQMRWGRIATGVAVMVIGLAVALLWDPTVCIYPAGWFAYSPNPPLDYCSHQFVPLRLAIGLIAIVVGVLILFIRRPKDQVRLDEHTM
jgi:hypothetical protein